ncbi:NACHT domain-containing protein [Nostocaceae cyanobacterium CENA357]|uniref:NACHT domain-containing protein n=1 Tax=Atlanticothrix silvestris CENA357 TaxID=1725252 RepID=A0A8J7L4V0_9CYAN|nr:NB-ARC domain-containing protein [Atlanticothrix silvestris]MBH8555384.1 NACHT domain-containing protein [Atlanticothrix silvestris CENA357]
MVSLKVSQSGKLLIKKARIQKIEQAKKERIEALGKIEKAWDMDEIFLREASKILEPRQNWDNAEIFAVAPATWKRFKEARQPIKADTFKAFCQVLNLKWENVAENELEHRKNLSEAPDISNFYGRTQELAELQQWLVQEHCRLVVIHGIGGIGKSALARHLVDKIADKYDYLIWLSLTSAPPFLEILIKLVHFLSKGEKEEGDISQLIQYLNNYRCLIVLDGWEEITDNESEDYANYSAFVDRVAKEVHRSSLLLLSRTRTPNIEILEGKLVRLKRLGALAYEEATEILKAEGISATDSELKEFSKRYSNPWILKRIAQKVQNVSPDISDFLENTSVFVDDVITQFLDQQFQELSKAETTLIYWVALRRNSATWHQLVQDSHQFFSYNQLFKTLDDLISKHSFIIKNIEDITTIYILDPVVLKYTTERFVQENFQEIFQVINSKNINDFELFITHNFITEHPEDEELNQEQMRRIVKPIQKMLLAELHIQERGIEEELRQVLSLLKDKGLSQGYGYRNISYLIAVCEKL